MAVTKSWSPTLTVSEPRHSSEPRPSGSGWLPVASLLVAAALAQVFAAKTETGLTPGTAVINLNAITSPDDLKPLFQSSTPDSLFAVLQSLRPLKNVGAIARKMPRRLFAQLKPLMIVRTPREFRIAFFKSVALYFAGFYLVALFWRLAHFQGDRSYLVAVHLLTGIGFSLMVSMRDPLRDTLEFEKFALGVFLGCVVLAFSGLKFFDYRKLSDWCYTPLLGALILFGLLLRFGRGPGGTDVKVNLGPFQPVEAIKILIVLFLAGYFTRNWERLRDLREKRIWRNLWQRIGMPRLEHVVPALCAVGAALVLFFVLKDLGPALVTFFVFLTLFASARGRPGLAIAALCLMVASVAIGYRMGKPPTVVDRINMWLAPWDNDVHGGDQLAHGIWAFSTGGPYGSGPGWGDPEMIPAGNTDLVLPAIGEEWGFAGVTSVLLLFAFLVIRALRSARNATTHYGFFLALGMGSLIGYEMLLISSGVLGLLPLSGVVSPFLSSGNTAMLANFLIIGILVSVSADASPIAAETSEPFHTALPYVKSALALPAIALLAMAARYQVFEDSAYIARDAHSFEQDGIKRPQHNPRLNSIAREIPRGGIYDRNGIPVATSHWEELEHHRAQYEALGVSLDNAVSRFDSRHYPFGVALAHIVGDLRTGENFHATNASLVEHDSNAKLQGYDYSELAGLVRYRHQPGNPAIARVLARDRNVHLTLDVRLQLKAEEILAKQLEAAKAEQGSVVVMDASTGDVLAMASAPLSEPLDRARYGLYPPGSTFKLVTAMAALRKDPSLTHRTYACR
ncbi:MAG: FtsW/RodA/SpoVE family cell cycle protein, partial [Acidobacteriia bacterium]|nr:FtsW/RodA/SpoVE family cell cycle protein [Terriglobia bacterium]